MAKSKEPPTELSPRHVKALARALREASTWRGTLVGNPDTGPLEEFDRFIATAKEGMQIVRELGRQHANSRKYAWSNGRRNGWRNAR
jgi:hypothetical protein